MPVEIGLIGATAIAERAMLGPTGGRDDVRVRAVAASDPDRARAYARRNGIPLVHDDYPALVDDPTIDMVYVSLHNSAHHRWTLAAVRAGKHVVVEKPLCLTADEVAEVAAAAASTGARVVEAVPGAGHPWQKTVRSMVDDQRYGPLRVVRTGIRFGEPTPGSYRDRPELGGGIFLDTASYWLQALQATVGLADASGDGRVEAVGPHGADRAFRSELTWADGRRAELSCAVDAQHLAEHSFEFAGATVRLRHFLRPVVGAVPLNLIIAPHDGDRHVQLFAPVAYYQAQFEWIHRYLTAPRGAGRSDPRGAAAAPRGSALAEAGERITLMAQIHTRATRDYRERTR